MAYSGVTKNLGLPQWSANDKPNFDIDINSAFEKIDDFAGSTDETAGEVDAKLNAVNDTIGTMQNEITSVSDSVNVVEERVTELEKDTVGNTASINKLNTDVSQLQTQGSSQQTAIDAVQTSVSDLENQVTLNTNNITSVMGDVGDWSTAYPTETIAEKVQELESSGGGDRIVSYWSRNSHVGMVYWGRFRNSQYSVQINFDEYYDLTLEACLMSSSDWNFTGLSAIKMNTMSNTQLLTKLANAIKECIHTQSTQTVTAVMTAYRVASGGSSLTAQNASFDCTVEHLSNPSTEYPSGVRIKFYNNDSGSANYDGGLGLFMVKGFKNAEVISLTGV